MRVTVLSQMGTWRDPVGGSFVPYGNLEGPPNTPKMYSYELYIGPTIQSRSAARRAVQDLGNQNDYITTFIKGVGPSDCKKYKGEG